MSDNNKTSNQVTRIIIILSIIIAAISAYMLIAIDLSDKPMAGQGSMIDDNVQIGGPFTLTDHNGNEFSSEMMKGKPSLVYFGFTFCPDICPTSLQKLSEVISILDKYQIDILPIFITIDPLRDNQKLLKEYLGHFHKKFIGLTGSEAEIKFVADLYKVFYTVAGGLTTEDSKYMLDHTSFVYLMDSDGKYAKHFFMNSTIDEIVEYIRINKNNL